MQIHELLAESFPYPAGSPDLPANITDLRDPGHAKGKYMSNSKDFYGQKPAKRRFWQKTPTTCVVLTTDGGVLVYYYGDRNIIPWPEVLAQAQSKMDKRLQDDTQGIVTLGTGYLISRARNFGQWSGDRNAYSVDVAETAKALLERGIANNSTPIWLGNWAAKKGEHVGTVGSLIAKAEKLNRIVVYHGTDTLRLQNIMKNGLSPLSLEDRVWNKGGLERVRPAHREDSVYLTASKPQAEYYAKKAVNIDRARFGPSKRADARRIIDRSKRAIQQMTAALERFRSMTPEQIAAEDAHARKYDYRADLIASKVNYYPAEIERAKALLARAQSLGAHEYYGKIEPVILQVTLSKREFDKLMADDDHLRANPEAKPEDWQHSLSNFSQVAFRGTIPPNRIKIIAQGNDADRKSR